MKKRGVLLAVISAVSLVISLFSLYLAIIILGPADEFFIFSALTAVLGILGLISSLGKGKAAFGCLISNSRFGRLHIDYACLQHC